MSVTSYDTQCHPSMSSVRLSDTAVTMTSCCCTASVPLVKAQLHHKVGICYIVPTCTCAFGGFSGCGNDNTIVENIDAGCCSEDGCCGGCCCPYSLYFTLKDPDAFAKDFSARQNRAQRNALAATGRAPSTRVMVRSKPKEPKTRASTSTYEAGSSTSSYEDSEFRF
jgi:hypothetical protein